VRGELTSLDSLGRTAGFQTALAIFPFMEQVYGPEQTSWSADGIGAATGPFSTRCTARPSAGGGERRLLVLERTDASPESASAAGDRGQPRRLRAKPPSRTRVQSMKGGRCQATQ
jgi:hypothetical protein